MKTVVKYLILLVAAASMIACSKNSDDPQPQPSDKSLKVNVRLYFTSDADPYMSYKIYAVAQDQSRKEITSKATKAALDTVNFEGDKEVVFHTMPADWKKADIDKIYVMTFEDNFTSSGTYGYQVIFTKTPDVSIQGEVKVIYDWSFVTVSSNGLEVSPTTNTHLSSFDSQKGSLDSAITELNKEGNRKFTVRSK